MPKLRVGLLFGGRSVEHEVSIASATSILQALDPERYDVSLIAIDCDGRWHLGSGAALLPAGTIEGSEVLLPAVPGGGALLPRSSGEGSAAQAPVLDVIFPIVHGRGGEDGALQGLLELADVPYVGSNVLSSAVQMDKDVAKRLLAAAGLPVVPWVTLRASAIEVDGGREAAARIAGELGMPVFVKPANSGSSVGITKARDEDELAASLREATRYDDKIIAERALDAREIEVAVLGNEAPEASVPGEIVPHHEFYDYEAKYHDETTELVIPAPLSDEESARLRALAIEAYRALDAEGMARVDFLVERADGTAWINELNSLPGFTDGSMYPRLWEASGLPYSALLDRLIELALERHRRRSRLETRYRRSGA
jgi:D-alanine-D-alanine ligase